MTSWTVAHRMTLSVGFPRQEYGNGLPFPCPGDLPDPGIEPESPAWQADSLPLSHLGSPYLHVLVHYKKDMIRDIDKHSDGRGA